MLDRGERSSCSGCGGSLRRNPLAGACQKALCLGNGAPDDVFGRGDVLNEGDGFSAHLVLSFVWCGPTTGVLQALCIVPMSRRCRVGIVGIASPPSTAGTRGKTNLSRMGRFAGKDRGASDSFSQSSGKSQAPRLCPKDVHDHLAWTPELGFPPASKWRYTWMLRPEGFRRVFLLERWFDGFRKILDNCRGSRQQQPLDQPLGHRGRNSLRVISSASCPRRSVASQQ